MIQTIRDNQVQRLKRLRDFSERIERERIKTPLIDIISQIHNLYEERDQIQGNFEIEKHVKSMDRLETHLKCLAEVAHMLSPFQHKTACHSFPYPLLILFQRLIR